MDGFLLLAFVFLAAGIVAVPIATRLGLGSVLGFLIAGIAISPILQALGVDVVAIQHFAEFGVVMMLFLVGLELEPRLLWQMKLRLLGLGGLQMGLTTAAVPVPKASERRPLSAPSRISSMDMARSSISRPISWARVRMERRVMPSRMVPCRGEVTILSS